MTDLTLLRTQIDEIDRQIIGLLAQRFKHTEEVGMYKAHHGIDAQDTAREAQQFQKLTQLSEQYGLNPEYARDIYRRMIDLVIERHRDISASARTVTAER